MTITAPAKPVLEVTSDNAASLTLNASISDGGAPIDEWQWKAANELSELSGTGWSEAPEPEEGVSFGALNMVLDGVIEGNS